jgi:hypothetical protein
MARWQDDTVIPGKLATFNRADWPGDNVREQVGMWREARKVYFEQHPELEFMRNLVDELAQARAARREGVYDEALVAARRGSQRFVR